jgi:prevent-host-death family protein
MKTLPLAEVRANLTQLIDQVVKHDEPILITRNGRPAAVLLSADEYDRSAERRWRAVNAPHLVALVRAGARFDKGVLVERPDDHESRCDRQVA